MEDDANDRVTAGPVTFVVEHRHVVQNGTEFGGPSIRVLGSADEHEYLRFDMFTSGAHYHYEPPGADERRLDLDVVAEGDALSWALDKLRHRLGPMLIEAGGGALADTLVPGDVTRAVGEVEARARS